MSRLTQKQLDQVRETYKIPNYLECRLPSPGHTVGDTSNGEVVFYPFLFKLGRFPLHQFFCRILTFYEIYLTQLAPSEWIVLLGIVVLSHLSGVAMDLHTL